MPAQSAGTSELHPQKDNFLFLENELPKLYASLNSLEIINLFVVNKVEIPFKFSEIIVKEDRDNLHFAVGRFIEGLLNNKE